METLKISYFLAIFKSFELQLGNLKVFIVASARFLASMFILMTDSAGSTAVQSVAKTVLGVFILERNAIYSESVGIS